MMSTHNNMIVPSATTLLDLWDRGPYPTPLDRALALLQAALPHESLATLARLTIGQRDRGLLQLRANLFGPRMAGSATCPRCATPLELDIAVADLLATPASDVETALCVVTDGHQIHVRLPSTSDLAELTANGGALALVERCMLEARDATGALVEALPAAALPAIAAALAHADPLADIQFELACPQCHHRWHAPFDIVAFLWNELDAWARRLLVDVHTLARAYGWSEREILGLSPRRRAAYLQMVYDERLPG